MISLLIFLIIILVGIYIVKIIMDELGVSPNLKKVIYLVILLILLIALLNYLGHMPAWVMK